MFLFGLQNTRCSVVHFAHSDSFCWIFLNKSFLDRNVNIITDFSGNKVALTNDIMFKGKQSSDWDELKIATGKYFRRNIGDFVFCNEIGIS